MNSVNKIFFQPPQFEHTPVRVVHILREERIEWTSVEKIRNQPWSNMGSI
jgi:hypothetical protein